VALIPAEIIKKKRNGHALTNDEIGYFVSGFTKGTIPDYQMSALMMAIYFQDMTTSETAAFTNSVLHSGTVIDLSHVPAPKVDKHSTGGVGDKTSLILGPLVASLGVPVPMISGRGLGHTGGTVDKMESIPGFNMNLGLKDFVKHIEKYNICFTGQTQEICPADKKMYALRDVTATVESLPLICTSILSKKLAEGIDGLVLDVKVGSGAFMKTPAEAEELATALMDLGKSYNKKMISLLTNMDQPLGRFAGNAFEVYECLEIMNGNFDIAPDTVELSLWLSAHMIRLAGLGKSDEDAYDICKKQLLSGKAYEKFLEMCKAQGGDLEKLTKAKQSQAVSAGKDGFVSAFDTEKIGLGGIILKAGREKVSDVLDYGSGIEFHKKIGDEVKTGENIFTVYSNDQNALKTASEWLKQTFTISLQKPQRPSLIMKTLR
jgi:pyrimidine-nucleoside phosphorylase